MQVPTKRFAVLFVALAAATCALAALLLFMSATAIAPAHAAMPATAGDWFITANSTGSNVYIGNTIYDRLYGPFGGIFGSEGGGLFDMAVTPDGKTAMVSNFGDGAVYFIDVTDPSQPALDLTRPISVDIGFFAEDIAVTTDGKYALVTDGGFSVMIASINLLTHRLAYTFAMTNGHGSEVYGNAVDVGPDGTVIVADYWNGGVHTLLIDDDGQLTYANTYTYWLVVDEEIGRPVNVALAPDAQTLLVCDAITTAVPIYQITSPGELSWKGLTEPLAHNPITPRPALRSVERPGPGRIVETGIDAAAISGPSIQSVAFRTDGKLAYAVINNRHDENSYPLFNQVGVLDITGPGEVRVSDDGVPVTLETSSSSQLFGVDVIAVAGHKAYVGQPTISIMTGTHILSVVDLDTYEVFTHEIEGIATGVSTIPLNNYRLPIIERD